MSAPTRWIAFVPACVLAGLTLALLLLAWFVANEVSVRHDDLSPAGTYLRLVPLQPAS